MRCGICEIRMKDNSFAGAVLDDASTVRADACVVAVPHDSLLELLPPELARPGGLLEGLCRLKASPITGVHLWFDRTVMAEPFLTLLDHTTQWIFNKTLLSAQVEADSKSGRPTNRHSGAAALGQYLQLVISASYDFVQRPRQEIIDLCLRELGDVLPGTREATLCKATVIKEVNATFSPEPGVDRWRPGQAGLATNLFLAGDWTRTGWPATMEGAVRSGYLAAEAVLDGFGVSRRFLQPELPCEGLSRFWASRSNGVQS